MKFIFIAAIAFIFSSQLLAQAAVMDSIAYDKLTVQEQEIRSGGSISIYIHQGVPYTGKAVNKKFMSYTVYEFKNGKKDGNVTHYSKNNRKKEEWEYRKGKLRASKEWYADGDLKFEREFTRKSRFKQELVYRRNGELKESRKSRIFSSAHKLKRYSLKGKVTEKGQETEIEKGKKVEIVKIGKWVYYDNKGKRKKVEYYDKNGKLISSTKT